MPKQNALLVYVGLANRGVENLLPNIQHAMQFEKDMNIGVSIARTNDFKSGSNDKEAISDYRKSMHAIKGKVSLIEVNISCPNTFAGEPFTDPSRLDALLTELDKEHVKEPVTLKMPADKSWKVFRQLLLVASKHNVQGVTISNLRKDRKGLDIPNDWLGNVSGAPTYDKSLKFIRNTYSEFSNRFTILGLGGVFTAEQAYEKIKAGASIVELVTSLMFKGPQLVGEINEKLVQLLEKDGFQNVQDAVGSAVVKTRTKNTAKTRTKNTARNTAKNTAKTRNRNTARNTANTKTKNTTKNTAKNVKRNKKARENK
jgi:dihydroorotate dehydrogenase (fumarate)